VNNVHICCFTAGLDELTRKQQKDVATVLGVLRDTKRFSVFEATANQTIAKTVTLVFERGLVENTKEGAFPWTYVVLTAAGERFLEDGVLPPKLDALEGFVEVARGVYVTPEKAKELGVIVLGKPRKSKGL
jgi:hypothetical protein